MEDISDTLQWFNHGKVGLTTEYESDIAGSLWVSSDLLYFLQVVQIRVQTGELLYQLPHSDEKEENVYLKKKKNRDEVRHLHGDTI